MHLEWNVIRLVYVYRTRNVITELFVFIIRNVPVWAMPPKIRTTVHALSGRTMTMSLLNGSYLSAQVREEGKIWLHWYFRQQNFL